MRLRRSQLRCDWEDILSGEEIREWISRGKLGRVFVQHWAILSTEREGYTMLNRSRNVDGKKLWKKLHSKRHAATKSAFEGARL